MYVCGLGGLQARTWQRDRRDVKWFQPLAEYAGEVNEATGEGEEGEEGEEWGARAGRLEGAAWEGKTRPGFLALIMRSSRISPFFQTR